MPDYSRLIDLSFEISGDVWPISVNGDHQNIKLRFWGEGQGEVKYEEECFLCTCLRIIWLLGADRRLHEFRE